MAITKKQQAQEIFDSLWSRGHRDRRMIISRFMSVLDMTLAGAATYYAKCKKEQLPDVATYAQQSNNFLPVTELISDHVPTWKQTALNKHNDVCKLAETLYHVDLSKLMVRFDLKGKSAGMACRRSGNYFIRYNVEAMKLYPEHSVEFTIPHEIAHIICFMRPELGKCHDDGWKRVCASIGGNAERCHQLQLSSSKKRKKHIYIVDDQEVMIGPKAHKAIIEGSRAYHMIKTKTPILCHNFSRTVII